MSTTLVRGLQRALFASLVTGSVAVAQTVPIDPLLPNYEPVQGVSGAIKSVGSDTMNNLMTLWAEGFLKAYPNVQVEIEGKGSSTAPPALIAGTANFGPMSRAMKQQEIDDFEKQFGYKPVALKSSIDMLAVYVHKDNPIRGLTLEQVDAIFSKSRNGGHETDVVTWGDAGLTGDWADKPISLYGRNSASGTYGFFKDNALFKGDFKDTVKEQPGSSSVVNGVANDLYGIGYSGIGYKTADVRVVPLKGKGNRAFVEATPENAYSGDYALSRFLFCYVNYRPGSELDPLRREFILYMFSKQGQQAVVKDGYYPITAAIAAESLASVGLKLPEPEPVEASAARD
ncbi:MAG TPA: phosphate ABC transporter substrate-binding protein [Planctomycetota bacterium]|nr:phosphate ABC transporter substrate-binding protein [Planctomycetota bacterium]